MDPSVRIEQDLQAAIARCDGAECPPRLAEALRYAVFPGGARVRPKLTLAVANACGDTTMIAACAAATAIELLHCASLVHDDLPCFDDAELRRGKPSVHVQFGQPLAVLAGDALIVMAFETLAVRLAMSPDRLSPLVRIVASCVGAPSGITAGQAWECEPAMDLALYQQSKTGALFAACTMAGAAAAGYDHAAWRPLGLAIGEAFQVADDIRDVGSSTAEMGKPMGQDAAHGRPNAVALLGLEGARQRFDALLANALDVIPECPGKDQLGAQIVAVSHRLVTGEGARQAA
jgi:geranylgeranyl diphosphate synthase, type II